MFFQQERRQFLAQGTGHVFTLSERHQLVLVRLSDYPETITINHPLILRGLRAPGSNEIPETMGLFLDNTGQQSVEGA